MAFRRPCRPRPQGLQSIGATPRWRRLLALQSLPFLSLLALAPSCASGLQVRPEEVQPGMFDDITWGTSDRKDVRSPGLGAGIEKEDDDDAVSTHHRPGAHAKEDAADSSDGAGAGAKRATAGSTCFVMKEAEHDDLEPFSQDEMSEYRERFLENLDVEKWGGGIVASPDSDTPGGSYIYEWERDSALSARALLDAVAPSWGIKVISKQMEGYARRTVMQQALRDPNDIDVRSEPKFSLPNGDVFDGWWCRPQSDGPGLRALTLMDLASYMDNEFIESYLWTGNVSDDRHGGAIAYDLAFIVEGGVEKSTCDLWEEVEGTDLFWNRLTAHKALLVGARFAAKRGEKMLAERYTKAAKKINATLLEAHWNKQSRYLAEIPGKREIDGAVILALNEGYDDEQDTDFLAPESLLVASTVLAYNKAFCEEFPINNRDTMRAVPGILYGRYLGDEYAGGNPWVLTTAALARLLYRAGTRVAEVRIPSSETLAIWRRALGGAAEFFSEDESPYTVSRGFLLAGDSVLLRLREHVIDDKFRLDEQLSRATGTQKAAKSLTWSYAELFKAMTERKALVAARKILKD
eukprot:TRINITY_DN14359_c0_g1_i1.p1 TRINITY_DN14359_c0_g1~~TRINITY_DN14359_c0_g1_i1.p1  ORF type:complete len:578 (-),score=133.74 TRINITY_DN14359_c0_g1_i1:48-1781(-)